MWTHVEVCPHPPPSTGGRRCIWPPPTRPATQQGASRPAMPLRCRLNEGLAAQTTTTWPSAEVA